MPAARTPAPRGGSRSNTGSNTGWWVALGLIVAAFAGGVIALNVTLYSAAGFVGTYLAALESKNPDAALATPGVVTIPGVSERLLQRDALGDLTDIELVEIIDDGRDTVVRFSFALNGIPSESHFRVTHDGLRLGLFNSWTFVDSPVSVLEVSPVNDARFTANGVALSTSGPSVAGTWQVLSPSVVTLSHSSTYLTADSVAARVTEPGTSIAATVTVRASDRFVAEVQSEVDGYLERCAAQTVLFPTGCPFGYTVSNRVEGAPTWSITEFPVVAIEPSEAAGEWVVPNAAGTARISVQVRSLFDGSVSTIDEAVDFAFDWVITIQSDDTVHIDSR